MAVKCSICGCIPCICMDTENKSDVVYKLSKEVKMTETARIIVQAHCPECDWIMIQMQTYIICSNSSCKLFGRKFEIPTIELKEIKNDRSV